MKKDKGADEMQGSLANELSVVHELQAAAATTKKSECQYCVELAMPGSVSCHMQPLQGSNITESQGKCWYD